MINLDLPDATYHITDEQIAAAQLKIVLDEKLGRHTPDLVRRIAELDPEGLTGMNITREQVVGAVKEHAATLIADSVRNGLKQ